ncbi:dTMP kinase [Aestuariivirga litoralis]|uniref:dTMP kinase n=1 Tax=Aestuariivirga litoralis TaxID=2650924 RepID=UPI0018C698D4|nr:dTMP kinase [Aestuariivirga litoralis]MBG1231583.1 dTMP kinase [Aestuariivirga litoralis]
MLITFEGGEGTGKSTQVKLLAERLRQDGKDVITAREPGGTPEGEALRNLLVSGDTGRWSAKAEALLNYAARDSHLRHVIRPALAKGQHVLCDRFMDSTRAYQAYAGGCPFELIDHLEKSIVADTRPALTLIFDLDPKLGLARASNRGTDAEDRFERKGLGFHQKLREGFLTIAKAEPQRCKLIDASQSIEAVSAKIWQVVNG